MPLPSFLVSANIFVCERVLVEVDNVLSFVRLVDVFILAKAPPESAISLKEGDPVPPGLPMVQLWVAANVKAHPKYSQSHSLQIKLINTLGEVSALGQPTEERFNSLWPDAHPALGIVAQLNLAVRRTGTCYLCLCVDDEEVARVPFTLVLANAQ
jgi:hypothetical protein